VTRTPLLAKIGLEASFQLWTGSIQVSSTPGPWKVQKMRYQNQKRIKHRADPKAKLLENRRFRIHSVNTRSISDSYRKSKPLGYRQLEHRHPRNSYWNCDSRPCRGCTKTTEERDRKSRAATIGYKNYGCDAPADQTKAGHTLSCSRSRTASE
jgi:hypothetical protein